MELGEKLLLARQEAGLSQRQLCGNEITRNMLSQIEHGTARPSMSTLQYLASRLGKPISFFLEEDAVVSANQQVMAAARSSFDRGEYVAVQELLEDYQGPDEVYDREMELMRLLVKLALAEEAILQNREAHALNLLREAEDLHSAYYLPEIRGRISRLLGRIWGQDPDRICAGLPNLDEDLLLRAKCALTKGIFRRAAQLLDAAEDHKSAQWNMLRGQAYCAEGQYSEAVECLRLSEPAYPRESAKLLERAFRELGDFQQAYYYACKVRDQKSVNEK